MKILIRSNGLSKLLRSLSVSITSLSIGLLHLTVALCVLEGWDTACYGDIITLKNGKQISVERVWEEGNKIRYEKDGNVYSFSKDLVEKVEAAAYVPEPQEANSTARKSLTKSIPIEVLNENLFLGNRHSPDGSVSIINEGKINRELFEKIENAARLEPRDPAKQGRYRNALIEVVNWQFRQGDQAAAVRNLQQYLHLDPGNLQASLMLASLYLRQGQYPKAEDVLNQAQIRNGDSSELYYLLGITNNLQDKNDLAGRALRRSLELKFRPEVDQMLKKIEGENSAENTFKQANSLHFLIKYEGTETNQFLGQEILLSLEKAFTELETELNYSPREPITVVLYTGEVFRDVTRTPSWVGALNDGKIRLPIKGLSRMDESLRKILKHELTHSFVRLKTGGTCPVWLNEGLAQYLLGDSPRDFVPFFKQSTLEDNLLPLRRLESPFVNLPYPLALLAYQESLLAVEFLTKAYGMGEIQRLLEQSINTADFEATLKLVLRVDYSKLQKELQEFVLKQ